MTGLLKKQQELFAFIAGSLIFTAGVFFTPPSILKSTDYILFYGPNFQFLLDSLKEGSLPLWNPHVGLGRPYLGDFQTAIFYPPLYFICLGKEAGVFLIVFSHILLAILGIKHLGARLEMSKAAIYLTAFSTVASVVFTGRLYAGQLLYSCALCYVPLVFSLAMSVQEACSLRRIAWLALTLALQLLSGHPQVFWFTAIGLAAFLLGRSIRSGRPSELLSVAKASGTLVLALAWSLTIAAVALMPFFELVQNGNRQGVGPEFASAGRLRFEHLPTLFMMMPGGRFVDWERNFFVGFPAAVIGIMGFGRLRDPNIRGLASLAVIAVLFGMANSTPLFDAFLKHVPGLASFRLHARFGFLLAFALLISAGIWLSQPHRILQSILETNFTLGPKHALAVLCCVQVLHLAYGNLTAKATYRMSNFLQAAPDYTAQSDLVEMLHKSPFANEKAPPRVCVPPNLVPANFAMFHHYSNFDAYTSLFLNRPWRCLHERWGIPPPAILNTRVSDEVYQHGPFLSDEFAISIGRPPDGTSFVVNIILS